MDKKERESICCVHDHELYRKDSERYERIFIYAENDFIKWDETDVKDACMFYELSGGRKDCIKDEWMPFALRSFLFSHYVHFANVSSYTLMEEDEFIELFLGKVLPAYISLYEKKNGNMQ